MSMTIKACVVRADIAVERPGIRIGGDGDGIGHESAFYAFIDECHLQPHCLPHLTIESSPGASRAALLERAEAIMMKSVRM